MKSGPRVKADQETIRRLVHAKHIKTITLDTSAFDRKGRELERSLLGKLAQFKGTETTVLLSDIVVRELRSHLVRDAEEAHSQLKKALRSVHSSCLVDSAITESARATLLAAGSPEQVADSRVKSFLKATGAAVLKASKANPLDEVLDRYFDAKPPFAKSDGKRHEFPDAFALLTLEAWAVANDTMILVVTHDSDWHAFIEPSAKLVAIDDLAEALGFFQDDPAVGLCNSIAESIRENDRDGILRKISAAIKDQESQFDVSVQVDSQFSVEDEYSDVSISDVRATSSKYENLVEPVEFRRHVLAVRLRLEAEVSVETHFNFSKWDSIDKEEIPMGSATVEHRHEVPLEVLVTFGVDVPGQFSVRSVEVVPQTIYAEFGDLEPDWMQNPDFLDGYE